MRTHDQATYCVRQAFALRLGEVANGGIRVREERVATSTYTSIVRARPVKKRDLLTNSRALTSDEACTTLQFVAEILAFALSEVADL